MKMIYIYCEGQTGESFINNSFETAPSKRLERLMPDYAKVKNGTIVSQNIGIDKIIAECPHFAAWVEKIKNC